MHLQFTPSFIARFWSRVDRTDSCWVWRGVKNAEGYGYIYWDGKMVGAHRIAAMIVFGEIPEGMFVCHHCDNPSCVRPDHLFLGTPQDNMQDMTKKGRNCAHHGHRARGMRHYIAQHPEVVSGERNGNAKLKEEDVRMIRSLYATGRYSLRQLGVMYGVHNSQISRVVKGERWTSVKS